MYRKSFLSIE